jgi:hypothetical protein
MIWTAAAARVWPLVTLLHTNTHPSKLTPTHPPTLTRTRTCTHAHTHTQAHSHAHAHTHTHTHTTCKEDRKLGGDCPQGLRKSMRHRQVIHDLHGTYARPLPALIALSFSQFRWLLRCRVVVRGGLAFLVARLNDCREDVANDNLCARRRQFSLLPSLPQVFVPLSCTQRYTVLLSFCCTKSSVAKAQHPDARPLNTSSSSVALIAARGTRWPERGTE